MAEAHIDAKLYSLLLEHAPMGIYIRDSSQNRFIYGNQYLLNWLNINQNQFLSWSWLEFRQWFHPEDLSILQTGGVLRLRKNANNYNFIDLKEQKISGNLILGYARDVTAEQALKKEISNEKDKNLQIDKYVMVKDMLSGIAHEINNPLAIIVGRCQALLLNLSRDKLSVVKVKEGLEKIENTAKRISKTIHSLRALSRDSDEEPWSIVSVETLLDDINIFWRQRLSNHGIDLRVENQAPDAVIFVKQSQVLQALMNLVSNAFNAIMGNEQEKERWIQILIKDENSIVVISVADSGPGMSEEIKKKIWDPFFTTGNPSQFSGMGLTVAASIISEHKGTISLHESEGHTCFTIRIPRFSKKRQAA